MAVVDNQAVPQPRQAQPGQPETYRLFETQTQEQVAQQAAGPRVFDTSSVDQSVAPTSLNDALYHSILTHQSVDIIRPMVDSGATLELDANARQITDANRQALVTGAIDRQAAVEEVNVIRDELLAMDNISRFVSPATLAMLTSENGVERDYAVQRLERLLTAQGIINDRMASASSEGFLTNFDFVDFALSSPQNLFLVGKQREFVERAEELMYDARVTPEEFEQQFTQILNEMSDQGFFTDENRFYLGDFVELFSAGNASSEAKWQKLWAAVDTVSFGLGAAPVAGRTVAGAGRIATQLRGTTSLGGAIRTGAGTASQVLQYPERLIGSRTNNPALVRPRLDEIRLADDPSLATGLMNQTFTSIYTPDLIRPERLSHTSSAAMRAFENESKILQETREIIRRTGSAFDETRLAALQQRLSRDARIAAENSGNTRYLDGHVYVGDFDNLVFAEIHGTNKGTSFVGPNGLRAAENLSNNIGGEVVEWQNAGHYVVVRETNIPTDMVNASIDDLVAYSATNVEELGEGFIASHLRSPSGQTTAANRASLLTAESVAELWHTQAANRISNVARLNSRRDITEVDQMFEMLRDGHFASQREAFTIDSFRTEFSARFGRAPTDSQVLLYATVQEARDVESFILADEFFKRQVSDGVVVLDNQYRVVPTPASDVPSNAHIYDTISGRMVNRADLAPGQTVYRSYDPEIDLFGTDALYATGSDLTTRRLYHSDIMARNSGGTRLYRNGEINHWIKQDQSRIMAGGIERQMSPLTIMGVKTADEARSAVNQLNNIISDLTVRLGAGFDNAAVASLRGNKAADDIVAANSAWNPNVHSIDTLVDWANDSGVNLSRKFDSVRHGESIIDNSVSGFGGMSFERAMDARALNPRSRRNSVLMGYGGKTNRTVSPLQAMQRTSSELIANRSYRAYMARSINGLMKSAIRNNLIENLNDLKGLSLQRKLQEMRIRDTKGAGARLALERKKILGNLNRRGLGDAQWEGVMTNLSNFLYNKGWGKAADFAADMASNNPATALRGFAFDAKLGMFNPAQLYVQASQTINVMAVGGMQGLRGGALYAPVRFALANGDEGVIRALGRRLSKVSGLNEDQFLDMVNMFRDHGRSMIGVSLAEFGSDAATASSVLGGKIEKARSAGRVFFNEGELVARTAAWNTAYIEYVTQFPTRAPRSQHGVRWIMNRQDTLTQSMSGASRLYLDKFPFTQFMSYQFRINEAIFAGTIGNGKATLTAAERLRLAAAHTIIFGASGWAVAGTAMDWYNYRFGTDIDEGTYRAIRKGALDYLLTEVSGVETSLSSRLGSGDSLFMLMRDMSEKNIFEMAGGPSLEVGTEAFGVILRGARALANGVTTGDLGDFESTMLRFGRMFSSGNQAYNAYTALKLGQYLSKDNALMDDNLTNQEALFLSLGVPMEDIEEAFKFNNMQRLEKLFLRETIRQVQRGFNEANAQLQRGDYEAATETFNSIALLYHSATPLEQLTIQREVYNTGGTVVDNITLRALQRDSARDLQREEN